MARINYKLYPVDYITELQQKGKREKARCFLEYFNDFQLDQVNSIGFYGKSWGTKDKPKSKGTVFSWVDEFKREIEMFFNYWTLKNEQHHSSVTNKSERQVNDIKSESERQNTQQSTIVKAIIKDELNDIKSESERQVNQGLNSLNNNNINAESNDSADKSSSNKKHQYSKSFEIIWNLYNKKTSNKNRAYSIYKKRWIKDDLELIKKAIEKYKVITNYEYIKDFDGFLNGVIDSYIPVRVWIKDKNENIHHGYFYDYENEFVSDDNKKLPIESSKVSEYIEDGRFGYAA